MTTQRKNTHSYHAIFNKKKSVSRTDLNQYRMAIIKLNGSDLIGFLII